jgi:hypothetical protein
MTVTTHWTDRLSEYLDDEMNVTERSQCDEHLAACAMCREALGELRMVVATAQADADRDPQIDLWPAVLEQIAPVEAKTRPTASRQFVFTLPQLALAASLLIAVSASVAYLAAGRAVSQPDVLPDVLEVAIQAFAEPMAPLANVERANFADAQYDEAVADLEKILVDLRDELNPQTVMVIERNLASIDQAIREARAALDGDPANTFLNSHLAEARRKKLDLLRRATMIHSTAGD